MPDATAKGWGLDVIRLEIQEFDLGKFAGQLLKQKEQEIAPATMVFLPLDVSALLQALIALPR